MLSKLKIKYHFINGLIIAALFSISNYVYAEAQGTLGGAASSILEPLGFFTEGLYKICYILGGTFILGSGLQYRNYRNNPSAVRVSVPIVLFLIGTALILLPVIASLSPASQAAASANSQ